MGLFRSTPKYDEITMQQYEPTAKLITDPAQLAMLRSKWDAMATKLSAIGAEPKKNFDDIKFYKTDALRLKHLEGDDPNIHIWGHYLKKDNSVVWMSGITDIVSSLGDVMYNHEMTHAMLDIPEHDPRYFGLAYNNIFPLVHGEVASGKTSRVQSGSE